MRAVKILIACLLIGSSLMSFKNKPEETIKASFHFSAKDFYYSLPTKEREFLCWDMMSKFGYTPTFSTIDFTNYEILLNNFLYSSLFDYKGFFWDFTAAEPTLTLWKQKHGCPTLTPSDSVNYTSNQTLEHIIFDGSRVKWITAASFATLTIRECVFIGSIDRALDAFGVQSLTIEDCYVELCGDGFKNSTATGTHILRYNWFKNITGPSIAPFNDGQSIQMIDLDDPGMLIRGNYIWNDDEETADPQDNINLFGGCNGASGNPIMIDSNFLWCRGATSASGSGINMADNGGTWTTTQDNVVLFSANVGVAVAKGSNCVMNRNIVYQPEETGVSNVGLVVWDAYGTGPSACTDNDVTNNRVYYVCGQGGVCGGNGTNTPHYFDITGTDGCTNTDTSGNIYTDLSIRPWERPPPTSDIPLRFIIRKK